jgi:hypothetical protein
MAYFVPEQERLTANAGSLSREVLQSRAQRWVLLNYFRNAAGGLAFVFLLVAALRPAGPVVSDHRSYSSLTSRLTSDKEGRGPAGAVLRSAHEEAR